MCGRGHGPWNGATERDIECGNKERARDRGIATRRADHVASGSVLRFYGFSTVGCVSNVWVLAKSFFFH